MICEGVAESVVKDTALAWLESLVYVVLHLPAPPACAEHADRQSIAARQAGGPEIAPGESARISSKQGE